MATTERLGSEKALERFGGAGMVLPWTRHMLTALWEQVRLLVQVIYYTFISVFQMFRFEVHVRITDESGPHSDPDPFLFSSLFSEETGPNPAAEALLSSLRADELCCDPDASIFLGHKHQSSWTVGDWNIFVSSGEPRCSDEDRSGASHWSSEEEHSGVEFDSDESRALWESLSSSSDPYNPFCFSACISTTSSSKAFWETQSESDHRCSPGYKELLTEERTGRSRKDGTKTPDQISTEESKASWETESKSSHISTNAVLERNKSDAEMGLSQKEENQTEAETPEDSRGFWETESKSSDDSSEFSEDTSRAKATLGKFWECGSDSSDSGSEQDLRGFTVNRSDSSSSWSSWSGSDSSEHRDDDELWDFFNNHNDPYNPLCFSATERTERRSTEEEEEQQEEELWRALTHKQDPYHPLNFKALGNQRTSEQKQDSKEDCGEALRLKPRPRGTKPRLEPRRVQPHRHPPRTLRHWKKHAPSAEGRKQEEHEERRPQKKVRFSDQVLVHVMRSWTFARQASRRGPWEEAARDRDRFKRRVQETERVIGHCFSPENRDRVRTRLGLD